jgi:hypothetical protein
VEAKRSAACGTLLLLEKMTVDSAVIQVASSPASHKIMGGSAGPLIV